MTARRVSRTSRAGALVALAFSTVVVSLFASGAGAIAAAPGTALGSFEARYGEDPRADYGRIRIPSIEVDAALSVREVPIEDPRMPNPYGPGDVSWYDFEEPYFGGEPGAGRNAVFSGHINYNATVSYAGVRYRGPGIFARLNELEPGDVVEVERDGETYRYAVSWTRILPGEVTEAWGTVLRGGVLVDSITLYTCDGAFDGNTLSYSDRFVVRAERLEGTPRQLARASGFTYGLSGTTHPVALFRAQRTPVIAIWAQHPITGKWLSYRLGAPSFVNTLFGHLRQDSLVIGQLPPE